jgi:hypothetical protein
MRFRFVLPVPRKTMVADGFILLHIASHGCTWLQLVTVFALYSLSHAKQWLQMASYCCGWQPQTKTSRCWRSASPVVPDGLPGAALWWFGVLIPPGYWEREHAATALFSALTAHS